MKILLVFLWATLAFTIGDRAVAEEKSEVYNFWDGKFVTILAREGDDFCAMLSINGYGAWNLNYFPKQDFYTFHFENSDATSLEHGEVVNLNIAFVRKGKYDFGWEERKFTVMKSDKVRFRSDPVSAEFANDISKSDELIIYREKPDGDVAIVFMTKLNETAVGVAKLRECAFKQSGLNPNDPFLQ